MGCVVDAMRESWGAVGLVEQRDSRDEAGSCRKP